MLSNYHCQTVAVAAAVAYFVLHPSLVVASVPPARFYHVPLTVAIESA